MQTLALEILMMWEDIRDQRDRRNQFRLGLLGQEPEQVKAMFADEFGSKVVNADEATDEEIEELIKQELAGESTEWATTAEEVDPEEVTRLLRRLASGEASLEDVDEAGWA